MVDVIMGKKAKISVFSIDIKKETITNSNFRKVLFTGKFQQLVVMCLKPNEEIGLEIHETVDQFFRIESGRAIFQIGKNKETILNKKDDDVVIVPAGTWHNVINESNGSPLKLYTIYAPPNHKDGLVQKNKPSGD